MSIVCKLCGQQLLNALKIRTSIFPVGNIAKRQIASKALKKSIRTLDNANYWIFKKQTVFLSVIHNASRSSSSSVSEEETEKFSKLADR